MYIKQQLSDTIKNILSFKMKLVYIVEPSNWSIKWDGTYITNELNKSFKLKSSVTTSRFALRNKILHFGSLGTFMRYNGIVPVHYSNKIVFTWFHVPDNDARIRFIPELNSKTHFVHTSCKITKDILINNGLNKDKIIIAPIGIDLNLFVRFSEERRKALEKALNLPKDKIIIGSFQKDGVGWGKGNEPKLIKGPDIFCDVVEKISRKHGVHVLLTGPSRGYVKSRLTMAGITFSHKFLDNYFDIVNYYNVLDLYLVTSRAEGGPKAITESMACGVPIISSKVGMATEIIQNGKNGFICEIDDIETMVEKASLVIENNTLKKIIVKQALLDVKNYTWEETAKILYEKIYSRLI